MWTTLDSVRRTILQEQLGGMMDIAGIIACIMAGISVLGTAREYIKGSELDMWDIAKPLAIMMLVCMFDTLVLGPVDSMTNIVTGGIVELLDTDTDDYISEWGRTMDVMTVASVLRNEKDYTEELEELADSSAMGRFFGTVWLSVKKTLLNMFNVKAMTFAGIIGGILFLLVKLLMFAQQILCCIYLLISSLLGPFILATSILRGFASGFPGWIARYIQISMWVPLGYIMLAINLWIGRMFSEQAIRGNMDLGAEWLMIVLQAVALGTIAAVPKIAAWVIESTGTNGAHGGFSETAMMAARKIFKI